MHTTFGFDGEYESKLDFSKTTDQKVAELIAMQLLLLDEVSMLDVDIVASVFCCNSSYPDLGPFDNTRIGEWTVVNVGSDDEDSRARRSCALSRFQTRKR